VSSNCNILDVNLAEMRKWTIESEDGDYQVEVSILSSDVLHLDVFGYATEKNQAGLWAQYRAIIENDLLSSPFFLIHNYENFKGGSTHIRKQYLDFLHENAHNFRAVYFYGASPLLTTLIKTGKILSKKLNNTFVKPSCDEIIQDIIKIKAKNNNKTFADESLGEYGTSLHRELETLSKNELIDEVVELRHKLHVEKGKVRKELLLLYENLASVWWDNKPNKIIASEFEDGLITDLNNAICMIKSDIQKLLDNKTKLMEKAMESDRLKSAFLANLSHEVRTPMNGIQGFSELLAQTELKPQQKEYVKIISDSVFRLLKIMEETIEISKLQTGEVSLSARLVKYSGILENVAKCINIPANKPGLEFRLIDSPEVQVFCDKEKIMTIINNLLENAITYSDSGFIDLGCYIENNELITFVKDSGCGIEKENLEVIFEKFRQIDYKTTRKFEGMGLGLAIAKQLVELHDGRLWAESEINEGSVFYFSLKLP
jgi:signal transduction histidine kinase